MCETFTVVFLEHIFQLKKNAKGLLALAASAFSYCYTALISVRILS